VADGATKAEDEEEEACEAAGLKAGAPDTAPLIAVAASVVGVNAISASGSSPAAT